MMLSLFGIFGACPFELQHFENRMAHFERVWSDIAIDAFRGWPSDPRLRIPFAVRGRDGALVHIFEQEFLGRIRAHVPISIPLQTGKKCRGAPPPDEWVPRHSLA